MSAATVDPKVAHAKALRAAGITARKHGGDDAYSWAVFIRGRAFVTGLGFREVAYYKRRALEHVQGVN